MTLFISYSFRVDGFTISNESSSLVIGYLETQEIMIRRPLFVAMIITHARHNQTIQIDMLYALRFLITGTTEQSNINQQRHDEISGSKFLRDMFKMRPDPVTLSQYRSGSLAWTSDTTIASA